MSQDIVSKKRRPTWAKAFLAVLAETGIVGEAALAAGVCRDTPNRVRKTDASFARDWEIALEQAADLLEKEARRRAVDGVEEPVFGRVGKDQDGQIGTIRKYSDTLLIFTLKGCRPEKYRERQDVKASVHLGSITDLVARVAQEPPGDETA